MITSEARISPTTASRMKPLRRRSDMRREGTDPGGLGGRGQHDEQAPVVVVGGEQVGGRPGGEIALGMDLDRLLAYAHAPLQRGGDVVGLVLPPQSEDLVDRPADDLFLTESGQLARAAAEPDQ